MGATIPIHFKVFIKFYFIWYRGGKINAHEGNVKFRELVSSRKPQYRTSSKAEKTKISKEIVNMVLSRGGRFLVEVSGSEAWEEVGLDRAKKKCSQALREDYAPEVRAYKEDARQKRSEFVPTGRSVYVDDYNPILRPEPCLNRRRDRYDRCTYNQSSPQELRQNKSQWRRNTFQAYLEQESIRDFEYDPPTDQLNDHSPYITSNHANHNSDSHITLRSQISDITECGSVKLSLQTNDPFSPNLYESNLDRKSDESRHLFEENSRFLGSAERTNKHPRSRHEISSQQQYSRFSMAHRSRSRSSTKISSIYDVDGQHSEHKFVYPWSQHNENKTNEEIPTEDGPYNNYGGLELIPNFTQDDILVNPSRRNEFEGVFLEDRNSYVKNRRSRSRSFSNAEDVFNALYYDDLIAASVDSSFNIKTHPSATDDVNSPSSSMDKSTSIKKFETKHSSLTTASVSHDTEDFDSFSLKSSVKKFDTKVSSLTAASVSLDTEDFDSFCLKF